MFQEKFVVQNHKLVILWLMNKLDEFSHSFPLKLDPFINAELRRINDTWENILSIFPIVVGNVFTDSCWFSVFVLQCGVKKVSRFRWRKLWDQYRGAGPSPTEVDQVDNDKRFYLIEELKARIIQFELEVAICNVYSGKNRRKNNLPNAYYSFYVLFDPNYFIRMVCYEYFQESLSSVFFVH